MSNAPQSAQDAPDPLVLRRADLSVAALLVLIAIAVFVESAGFPAPRGADIGAAGFPRFYAGVLVVLAGILSIKALRRPVPAAPATPAPGTRRALARVTIGIGICLAGFLVMQVAGFVPATALQLVALMVLMGRRNPVQIALIAAALTGGAYLLFTYALHVSLPVGSLFE